MICRKGTSLTVFASQLLRFTASVLFVAGPFAPGLSFAQSPAPTPTAPVDSVPDKIAPGAKPAEPAQNLSEKLNQSNGVIQPKEVDPAIEKPAPKTLDTNVVPAPGGSPAPQPK